MQELIVYVKSSALGRSGIHWRKVSEAKQFKEIPDILKDERFLGETGESSTINDLINETKLSLVLVRCDKKLLLEVTGIESPERSNRLGRKVLNSVVWIGDDNSHNERILRELAARALMSFWGKYPEFIKIISSAVEFDGLEGFKGDFKSLNKLAANGDEKLKVLGLEIEESESDKQEDIWEAKQIDSNAQIESLAKQLATCSLPEGKDLVVIAEMPKEGVILYKGIVWEGTENDEIPIQSLIFDKCQSNSQLSKDSASTSEDQEQQPGKKKRTKTIIFLGWASVLIVTMSSVVWVLSQRQETPQKIPIPQILITPQPEITIPQIPITPQPKTKPSAPTQPNRQTKPQLPPNQQLQKTP